ncbi:MAG: SAM-dependent DNA methyltransferase, partial [Deltaproteobacteria bacterium]|nr:SAM-dependent DNA methyltransferase [Deltaproteobacteria bacterium]
MPVLPVEFRNKLERTIIEARDIAEAGAKAAIEAFAVHHYEPYGHMSPEQRKLRNHLRARARQLGDKQNRKGQLEITHLVRECAYEHWHRMLFARFLAENDLLIEPEMGIAVSLEECEELARDEGKDLWTLASEFAQRMLPQIFRPN